MELLRIEDEMPPRRVMIQLAIKHEYVFPQVYSVVEVFLLRHVLVMLGVNLNSIEVCAGLNPDKIAWKFR